MYKAVPGAEREPDSCGAQLLRLEPGSPDVLKGTESLATRSGGKDESLVRTKCMESILAEEMVGAEFVHAGGHVPVRAQGVIRATAML